MTIVNNDTISLIQAFEGFSAKAYADPIDPPGVCTIGYGTIKYPPTYMGGKKVKVGDPNITIESAIAFLTWEVELKADAVKALVKSTLNANQFGALVSFAYNLGESALGSSTLLKKVNANPNDPSIRAEFAKWFYSNGKPIDGLKRRRAAEADLYFKPA